MRVNFSGKCERCDSFAKQTRRSNFFPAQEIIHKKMSEITPVIEGNTMIRPFDGSDHPESGHIEIIIGPMFSGKTTELIRRLKRYRVAQYACLIIKYAGDTRYNNDGVTTHDKQILPAISTKKLMPVLEEALQYDVIGIDEGQFFPDVSAFADHLANLGKIVMVAALDGTFQKKAFGDILNLVPKSENVTKLTAVCTICFKPAAFTRRKTQEAQVEVIGGEDKYLAVCRDCFTAPIPPSPERPVLREFNTPMTDDSKLERTKAHRRLFARSLSGISS